MGVSRTQRERVAIRQQAVLEAYEIYGTVAKACEVARVARSEHYRWLRNRRYAARFREAEEHAIQALETEARRRAMVGIEKPIFYKGQAVTYVRAFSDGLLMFLLKAKRPDTYRDRGPNGSGPAEPPSPPPADARVLTRLSRDTLEQALPNSQTLDRLRATLTPTAIRAELRRRDVPLGTDDDLLRYVEDTFGVRIPRTRCCAAHRTPAEAFCDSYFARAPVTVWNASRAFGGKTFLLSLLALTEALTLEVSVTVLGGSGQQSARVLDAMGAHWRAPAAPVHLLDGPPGLYTTRLLWGNTVTALTASQPSVRGAHPARLRLDEADEMRLPILEAAQGQPMDQGAVRAQTVIASTHQHPDGTMTAVLRRAAEQGWPVYEWCYRETLEPHGWLTEDQVTRKRTEITAQMWRTEFDLQEPSAEGRAIDPEAVEWAFDAALGEAGAAVLDHGWEATPTTAAAAAAGWYAHGADWAQAVDFTVVVTLRCDVQPLQLVAATRTHRRPWPVMIGILNAIGTRYPGPVAHDATGGGTVVAEYVTLHDVIDFQMTGRQRRDLFISYIAALERHELKLPRLEPFYREHKYCRVDDLFGKGHPPDTVVAMALAYHAFRTGRQPGDYGVTI